MSEARQGREHEPAAAEDTASGVGDALPVPAKNSWMEWKDRCAIGLCTRAVQNELGNFAGIHFKRYLRRYAYRTNLRNEQIDLNRGDAWHLFETYLTVRNTRQGKKYKDWLYARSSGTEQMDLKVLAGGASLLIRDVAREHLRREYSPSSMISLNSPVDGLDETRLTLEDLLPGAIDPVDEVAKREFEQLATQHAQEFFAAMNRRERIAVLAKIVGISLANREVEKAAGCRKSVLSQSYRKFILNAAARMNKYYSTEDTEAVKVLTLMTLQAVKEVVKTWAGSSSGVSRFLSTTEAP
jgi:hypothetical protein